MAVWVTQNADISPAKIFQMSVGINSALRGELANTGQLTVVSGSASATVRDSRCRAGRLAMLMPLNAAACRAPGYLSAMTKGSMTFSFPTAPAAEAIYGWVLAGEGKQ